jgi:DNA-directed RNA polymerase specialized sigma24 family protein
MIERYYRHGHSLAAIAQTADRTANAVGVMLHRIRQILAECIKTTLDRERPNERPSEV